MLLEQPGNGGFTRIQGGDVPVALRIVVIGVDDDLSAERRGAIT